MCVRCWHAYLQNEALVDRELACHVMQHFDNWLYTKTPRLSMCFVHLAVLGAQQVAALYRAHTSCLQREQLNRIIIISCFCGTILQFLHSVALLLLLPAGCEAQVSSSASSGTSSLSHLE